MPIAITNSFKPVSLQERLVPFLAYQQAYEKTYDKLLEYSDKIAMLESLANSEKDAEVYDRYRNYADTLNSYITEMSSNGLNPVITSSILGLRTAYNTEINPIATAFTERKRQAQAQEAALLADPTKIFNEYASDTPLNRYMDNPEYSTLLKNYSGAAITKTASEVFSTLKEYIIEAGRDSLKLSSLGIPYQYIAKIMQGASPDDVLQLMLEDGNPPEILKKALDGVVYSTGIPEWGNDKATEQAYKAAKIGAFSAIGKSEYKNYTDEYSMKSALQEQQADLDLRNKIAEIDYMNQQQGQDNYYPNMSAITDDLDLGNVETIREDLNKDFSALGFKYDDKGNVVSVPVRYYHSVGRFSDVSYNLKVTDNSGELFSKDRFVKVNENTKGTLGAKPMSKKELENYYDNNILPVFAEVSKGVPVPMRTSNIKQLMENRKKDIGIDKPKGSLYVKGINFNFGADGNKDVYRTHISKIVHSMGQIYAISGVNSDGSIKLTGKPIKPDKLMDKVTSDKSDLSYYTITVPGKQGLVLMIGSDKYFIPKNKLSNTAQEAFNNIDKLDNCKKELERLESVYGEEVKQSQRYLTLLRDAETYAATFMSEFGYGAFGKYSSPSVDLIPGK